MAEAPVKVLKVCSVKPAMPTATNNSTMFLCNVDLLFLAVKSVDRLLFYPPPPPPRDISAVLQSLKSSLSLALVHFYPLAGRLVVGEDNRPHIHCNDAGVEFIEASTDFPFQELETDDFQRKPMFGSLVHSLAHRNQDHDRPLLSLQVTSFGGGGVCIGFALNHVVADGKSIWHFMKSWAECSRGVPISAYPHHDRILLSSDNLTTNNYRLCFKDGVLYFEADGNRRPSDSRNKKSDFEGRRFRWDEDMNLQCRTFHLSKKRIEELKARACGPHSSFVSVAAHFWKCVMKAREVPPGECVSIYMLADMRGRLNPPLPPNFFGNCLHFTGARTTAAQLFTRPLSYAASLIQNALNSCTQQNFKAMVNWIESYQGIEDFESGYSVEVVASPRFATYEIDYGWRRPAQVQAASFNEIGQMLVYPGRDEVGGFDVSTCLPPPQMRFFLSLHLVIMIMISRSAKGRRVDRRRLGLDIPSHRMRVPIYMIYMGPSGTGNIRYQHHQGRGVAVH